MDVRKTVGANVRRLRNARKISQGEFEGRFAIDRTYLSGIERGKRNPTIEIMQKLADALEVDIRELFAPVD